MAKECFAFILAACAGVFNAPSFANFQTLVVGWVLAPVPGLPASALRALGERAPKHFCAYYRFFGRAVWDLDALGTCLVLLLAPFVPDPFVTAVLDDTLARKQGRHIWGANVHRDPLGFRKKGYFCFAHAWVVLAVLVRVPGLGRLVAVPVYFRLYRSPKKRTGKDRHGAPVDKAAGTASPDEHRARTALAVEMLWVLRRALGERPIRVLGDTLYAGKSVAQHLPAHTTLVSRVTMDAALYAPAPPRQKGQRGRTRKKGERLESPRQRAQNEEPWTETKVFLYGHTVRVRYKSDTCLWYRAAGSAPVRVVVVQDPEGLRKDECFYSTDPALTPEQILEAYGLRWNLEVAFRDVKQLLGFERPQSRTQRAVERTGPFPCVVYALTVVWFARYGHAQWTRWCPVPRWYRHKSTPSFADMLTTLRLHLHQESLLTHPAFLNLPQKYRQPLEQAIRRAA